MGVEQGRLKRCVISCSLSLVKLCILQTDYMYFDFTFIVQVHLGICIGCQEKFNTKTELTDHMHEANHTNSIPDIEVWDQPQ